MIIKVFPIFLVRRQLREPIFPPKPEWRNFGKLSDAEALKAEKLLPDRFEVSFIARVSVYELYLEGLRCKDGNGKSYGISKEIS